MKSFKFLGTIPASKSILNRALICSSYNTGMKIIGHSKCNDVVKMREGLFALEEGKEMDCGSAGTTLRFLSLRASRAQGRHVLTGSHRLFSRPQKALLDILEQLQVDARLSNGNQLIIDSKGWQKPSRPILVDRSLSSQFISSLLINAWGLDFPIVLEWKGEVVSDGYWDMTVQLMKHFGMDFINHESSVEVHSHQRTKENIEYLAESDLSSCFAVAALAVVGGEAKLENFPDPSLQIKFIETDSFLNGYS